MWPLGLMLLTERLAGTPLYRLTLHVHIIFLLTFNETRLIMEGGQNDRHGGTGA